jgi:hypothetical protein
MAQDTREDAQEVFLRRLESLPFLFRSFLQLDRYAVCLLWAWASVGYMFTVCLNYSVKRIWESSQLIVGMHPACMAWIKVVFSCPFLRIKIEFSDLVDRIELRVFADFFFIVEFVIMPAICLPFMDSWFCSCLCM